MCAGELMEIIQLLRKVLTAKVNKKRSLGRAKTRWKDTVEKNMRPVDGIVQHKIALWAKKNMENLTRGSSNPKWTVNLVKNKKKKKKRFLTFRHNGQRFIISN